MGFRMGLHRDFWAEAKERLGLLSRASSGAFAAKNPTVNSRAFRIAAMASSLRAKGCGSRLLIAGFDHLEGMRQDCDRYIILSEVSDHCSIWIPLANLSCVGEGAGVEIQDVNRPILPLGSPRLI